jgi:PHD/YefM family antitoxin component YafN of YafNO toxin-antitoxin module
MFSSTQLVRQSKKIFDKLSSNEIEKAVILRDGKPNFMLLDFNTYESIMKEFIQLKEDQNKQKVITSENKIVQEEPVVIKKEEDIQIEDEIIDNNIEFNEKTEEVNENGFTPEEDKELQEALKRLDELELDPILKSEAKEELKKERSTGEIKEFWN